MKSKPRPEVPTFFTDRCLGDVVVPDALIAAEIQVERHRDHFEHDELDHVWLSEVGKRGWVVLTKDENIERNQIEIVALLKSGAASFVLKSSNMKGPEMADAFIRAMPTIRRCLAKFDRPFLATVTKAGAVRIRFTLSDLIKRI